MTSIAELKIIDVAFGGKGVARTTGKTVFLPYVIDGETVRAKVVREHKRYAEAELETVLAPSPRRVEPRCPYFGRCGGCAYQHIEYEHQLALKSRQVQETLARIGRMKEPPMRPIIPSPLQYEYRNRVTVHARDGVIGYFRRESNELLDIECCPIASEEVNKQLTELRKGRPHDGHYTLRARPGARIFEQANDAVAESLLGLVDRTISAPADLLIDAYCGTGFFAKRLLDKFNRVVGIDWNRFAIAEAKKDATPKETYFAGNIEETLETLATGKGDFQIAPAVGDRRSLVMIVDPPATGLSSEMRAKIVDLAPAQLIYVSCNPATLARDLAVLKDAFTCASITPLDMFPQTAEIEVMASLLPTR
jgi:tRNA/tmRNA/rRNA uracil-C5-methylase (TrmA/RlmC/RlmD family)